MNARVKAIVKPELLKWARNSMGIDLDLVSEKTKINIEHLENWENGNSSPSIAQLRKLANIYKRPLAVFYLSEVPKEFDALHDYRILWGKEQKPISPTLKYEIRLAQYRRENALDIFGLIDESLPKIQIKINLDEDENILSKKIRKYIGISLEDQFNWKNDYEAFNSWRELLFNTGILVFQASKIEIEEMRGFSLYFDDLPIIVLNNKDSIRGRIFSMMHEFVHILLKKGGLCNLREAKSNQTQDQFFEILCNRLAGKILVPADSILNEDLVDKNQADLTWKDNDLLYLSNKYNVSTETILRRLLIEGKTTEAFYEKKREEYLSQRKEGKKGGQGHPSYHVIVLSKTGRSYAKLVLTGYHQDKINSSDLSDFLGLKLKHIPKVEAEVFDYL